MIHFESESILLLRIVKSELPLQGNHMFKPFSDSTLVIVVWAVLVGMQRSSKLKKLDLKI